MKTFIKEYNKNRQTWLKNKKIIFDIQLICNIKKTKREEKRSNDLC